MKKIIELLLRFLSLFDAKHSIDSGRRVHRHVEIDCKKLQKEHYDKFRI